MKKLLAHTKENPIKMQNRIVISTITLGNYIQRDNLTETEC